MIYKLLWLIVTLVNFFFISSELLSMPAVKRFSVSFAKHPTNGTSASFKYFSTSPPFVLHVFKLLFFDLGFFFPHGPPAFQVSVIFFPNDINFYNFFFFNHTLWTLTFLTLPDILFLTRVPTGNLICEISRNLETGNVSELYKGLVVVKHRIWPSSHCLYL